MTTLPARHVRRDESHRGSSIHRISTTYGEPVDGPVMVVSKTYIPIRRLQRLAPHAKPRLRPLWGRIALFVAFVASNPAMWFLPHLRFWIGLFVLLDVTAFVLTDDRRKLQVRVARTRKACGGSS